MYYLLCWDFFFFNTLRKAANFSPFITSRIAVASPMSQILTFAYVCLSGADSSHEALVCSYFIPEGSEAGGRLHCPQQCQALPCSLPPTRLPCLLVGGRGGEKRNTKGERGEKVKNKGKKEKERDGGFATNMALLGLRDSFSLVA